MLRSSLTAQLRLCMLHHRPLRVVRNSVYLQASKPPSPTVSFWDDSLSPATYATAPRRPHLTQVPFVSRALQQVGAAHLILGYGHGMVLVSLADARVHTWGCGIDPSSPLCMAPTGRMFHIPGP